MHQRWHQRTFGHDARVLNLGTEQLEVQEELVCHFLQYKDTWPGEFLPFKTQPLPLPETNQKEGVA